MKDEPSGSPAGNDSNGDERDSQMDRARKRYVELAKYSGMAIQLFLVVGISAWIGQKLDAYFETPKPFITVALIVFFTAGYFFKLYKDLTS